MTFQKTNQQRRAIQNFKWSLFSCISFWVAATNFVTAQVKIGDNPTEINPFAILEIESSNRGILIPRMTSEERDAAFGKDTPEGMMIFNLDESLLQIFCQEINLATGKHTGNENLVWEDVNISPIIPIQTEIPTNPVTGQIYFDTTSDQVYIYTGTKWVTINSYAPASGSSSNTQNNGIPTGTNSILSTGTTAPSDDQLPNLDPGALFVNINNGYLYVAADRNSDGTPDSWVRLLGPGSNGSDGLPGVAGPPGPPGPAGTNGINGQDGQGVLIGTSPPTANVASPTLFINSSTGDFYTNSGSSTWNALPSSSGTDTQTIAASLSGTTLNLLPEGTTTTVTVDLSTLGSGTDTQTIAFGTGATATKTTIEITDGNSLTLQASGSLVFSQTGTDTLMLVGTEGGNVPNGTLVDSTLRWDGNNWIENDQLLASSTQVTITTELLVDSGTTTMSLTNSGLDLNTTGSLTVSATSITVTGTAITVDGPSTFTTTVTLNGQVVDSFNSAGAVGEVLTATETGTQWANPNVNSIQTLTATSATPSITTSIILLEPTGDMTVNIPAVANYPVGFNLKIRRNQEYSSASSNTVALDPNGAETINGQATRDMNVGWQSLTLINTGSAWISID